MKTLLFPLLLALIACGQKPRPDLDAGPDDEDAGVDAGIDAGRLRGDEPPTGYTTALELPDNAGAAQRMGVSVSVALDQFNHPMIAAIATDPNNDGVRIDDRLVFTRWNGVEKKYQAPQTVAPIGEIDLSDPNRQVSLSRDPMTGTIGIAFITEQKTVRLALSDDEGLNWSLETVSLDNASGHLLSNPNLVLSKGVLHLGYFEAEAQCAAATCGQVVYRRRTGKAAFSDALSPVTAGEVSVAKPISLAVDSAGNAGIAYFSGANSAGAALSLLFWRPAGTVTHKIADSAGAAVTAQPSVSLTFAGETPRAAFHLTSASAAMAQLWYAAATDAAGSSFSPVAMPRNSAGTTYEGTQSYQALAIDSAGKIALAGYFIQTPISNPCTGGPKLARSNDGATFAVCRADATATFGFAGAWINAAFHAPGKVTLGFAYEIKGNPSAKPGVVIYRQP
jgi:hypothetical protein